MKKLKSESITQVFPFEKEITGTNVHSVYTLCPGCKTWGINMPMNKRCGDCGCEEGCAYYDAETINNYLISREKVKAIADQTHAILSLPIDSEVEKWYSENIVKDCSASSAIYKFRLWLKDRS